MSSFDLDKIFDGDNKARVVEGLQSPRRGSEGSGGHPGRHAAVLVPLLTTAEGPSVLFTVRSNSLSRHRNQVSFPGGLADETDRSLVETALRETEEEMGICRTAVDVWGKLPSLPVPERVETTMVTPVIANLGKLDVNSLTLSTSEVSSIFTLSLRHIVSHDNQKYTQYKRARFRSPSFLGGTRRVWGLTGIILDLVLQRLLPPAANYRPIAAFITSSRL